MFHYVYKISFQTGHAYFGVRSCECLPEEDTKYLGSPQTYKHYWDNFIPCKTIIRQFETREEANSFETELISWVWSVDANLSLNAATGHTNFCTLGTTRTEKQKLKIAKPYYLVSPEGLIYKGVNLREFCLSNKFPESTLRQVIKGKKFQYRGWTNSVENHQVYLKARLIRGVHWLKSRRTWIVRYPVDKRWVQKAFNTLYAAIEYRDSVEERGYLYKATIRQNMQDFITED
jgi:hypothetical protein